MRVLYDVGYVSQIRIFYPFNIYGIMSPEDLSMKRLALFIMIYLSSTLLSPCVHLTGATWYVRQDGTGHTTTIISGVLMSGPGDTVLVAPGSYFENTIHIEKSIHLISEAGPEETIINHMGTPSTDENVIRVENATDCSIIGFTIRGGHCDWASRGGGLLIGQSNVLVMNNRIQENWCANGGGIVIGGNPSPSIINNLIFTNGAFVGGGILVANSSPIIMNNTIVDNRASVNSGGLKVMGDSKPIIKYNLICYNSAPATHCGGADVVVDIDSLIFECNNVWSNYPTGSDFCGVLPVLIGINGNMSVDPLFCGEHGSGNYYLQQGSPCAEANVPECCDGIRIGYYPVNCSTGIENNSWGHIKTIHRNNNK
jgi:hypothetical protein